MITRWRTMIRSVGVDLVSIERFAGKDDAFLGQFLTDDELRRNITYLKGVSCEQLGLHSEAHACFLKILGEFPYYKDVRERVRRSYQKHLETALEPRAEVLEKRTQLDVSDSK